MSSSHRPLVVAGLLLSMFMAAMEATVVATAMPTVIADLGGLALYGWVGSAYLLACTVTVPLYGKLADLYGRKPVLLFGIALFLIGSVASGLSGSIVQLIVWRAVQGLGAGAMQPVTMTIVGDLYTVEERGRVQGFFGAVWGIAGVSGPLLGGFIVHVLSWHWVFWVNVPFGLASATLLIATFHERRERPERVAIDFVGAALLTLTSLALLAGSSGQRPFVLLPLAALGIVLFVLVERRTAEPVLPLGLIAERPIAVASVSSVLLGAAMMGTLTYVPLHLQAVLGRTPGEAGSVVALMLVGWPIAATITSKAIVRTGFRLPVWIGSGVCAVSLTAFALALSAHSGLGALRVGMFVYGFGMGLTTTSLIIAVQSSVGWNQRGIATASNMFSRTMGGALGVGALGAVFASRLGGELPPERVSALLGPERRAAVAHAVDAHLAALLDASMRPVFWAVAALAILNVLVVALYPGNAARIAGPEPEPEVVRG